MGRVARFAGFLLALLVVASVRAVALPPPAEMKDVGFDQRLNAQVPLDLAFADDHNQPVKLRDYFREGKPVVLVLAYYRCPMLCTLVLNGLVDSLREIQMTVGKDFEAVVVSFDPRETPALAAAKKETYVRRYGRPGTAGDWHFLTGKEDSIQKLTRAVGFRYVYDAQNDQFIHASGIVLLTPSGKISRYFYGIRFRPLDLRLGLVEASANKIGSLEDQILLYCCRYDASTGKYDASIFNIVRALGAVTILAVVALVWFLVRTHRRFKAAMMEEAGHALPPSDDARGDQR